MSMSEVDRMELEVLQGDWGLPSIDHNCLTVLAYCKFSDAPVKILTGNNPWKSSSGDLPILKDGDNSESKVSDIFNYLRQKNWGLDHELTTRQCADIVAFNAMLEEKLLPAILHLWWADTKNYIELTRPWFAKTLPFPLNFYMPLRKHKEYLTRLQHTIGVDNMPESEREAKIIKDAKDCITQLSIKLGQQDYFFGHQPSSMDAMVFGHLVVLLKIPFPHSSLQTHLKACSNLCQLCQRILNQHFPLSEEEKEELDKQQEHQQQQQANAIDFPHKRRNMMVAGAVALSAMVGYAFLSGLVSVEVVDEPKRGNNSLEGTSSLPEAPNFQQFDGFFDGENNTRGEGSGGEDRSDGNNNQ